MVHYKLTYFYGRGLGEVSRQLFILAEQDFEDVRLQFADWPALKQTMPFGQVPVLEVDGKQLAQSNAIARYLARKFGFAGKNTWDDAQVDALGDQLTDFRKQVEKYLNRATGFTTDDLETLKKEVFEPSAQKNLPFFVTALKKSGTGFLVGDSVTWPDLYLAELTKVFVETAPEVMAEFHELKEHKEKIHSAPQLKAWIEKRPDTNF